MLDFAKIKSLKDWITAAIGATATAIIPSLVIKGLVVAGAPFISDGIIWVVKFSATEYRAYRKRTEPIRLAKEYRATIIRNLKSAAPHSAEWVQLNRDRAEIDNTIHQLMMQRIRFSASTSQPDAPLPQIIPLTPPPALPPAAGPAAITPVTT